MGIGRARVWVFAVLIMSLASLHSVGWAATSGSVHVTATIPAMVSVSTLPSGDLEIRANTDWELAIATESGITELRGSAAPSSIVRTPRDFEGYSIVSVR